MLMGRKQVKHLIAMGVNITVNIYQTQTVCFNGQRAVLLWNRIDNTQKLHVSDPLMG